jgi:uracil-DNA glycosylase
VVIDIPKMFADPNAKAERMRLLREPHIAPLTDFVEALRIEAGTGAGIPYFDPWDGGIKAETLFLLEAPGAKAVASGFISRNNNDETAKNIFEICVDAGLERKSTILWNAVPWYIGSEGKIRAATSADLESGLRPLPRLLELLPDLRTIVLVGRKAEKASSKLDGKKYRILVSPHPSPLFVNHAPGNKEKILSVFRQVSM